MHSSIHNGRLQGRKWQTQLVERNACERGRDCWQADGVLHAARLISASCFPAPAPAPAPFTDPLASHANNTRTHSNRHNRHVAEHLLWINATSGPCFLFWFLFIQSLFPELVFAKSFPFHRVHRQALHGFGDAGQAVPGVGREEVGDEGRQAVPQLEWQAIGRRRLRSLAAVLHPLFNPDSIGSVNALSCSSDPCQSVHFFTISASALNRPTGLPAQYAYPRLLVRSRHC